MGWCSRKPWRSKRFYNVVKFKDGCWCVPSLPLSGILRVYESVFVNEKKNIVLTVKLWCFLGKEGFTKTGGDFLAVVDWLRVNLREYFNAIHQSQEKQYLKAVGARQAKVRTQQRSLWSPESSLTWLIPIKSCRSVPTTPRPVPMVKFLKDNPRFRSWACFSEYRDIIE